METKPEEPAMLLALPIGLNVFDRFCRRQTPSIWQRVSVHTMQREASNNHEYILN